MSPSLVGILVLLYNTRIAPIGRPILSSARQPPQMTDRQRRIVQLVAEGYKARDIGIALGITPRAVQHHKLVLCRDHQIETVADYVKLAVTLGLTQSYPAHHPNER